MKKIRLILPLLALTIMGCKTNSGSSSSSTPPVDSTPSGDSSSGDSSSSLPPNTSDVTPGRAEIDGRVIDQLAGTALYAKMPKIYSDDYEIFDESSEDYPVDIYIDLLDWSEDDALAYVDLLDKYPLTEDEFSIISEGFYAFVYLDEDNYDVGVFGINIFSEGDGGTDPVEPGDKEEIDGLLIDEIAGMALYAKMPKIYSNDYEIFDESSDDYPIDIYIDLLDWSEDDAYAYIDLLDTYPLTEDEFSIISEGIYAYVYLDEDNYDVGVYGINIFSEAEGGTDPTNPVEPVDKEEIDGSEIDAFFDEPVYSLLPKIYSNDWEIFDNSSEDYPIDIYVDLFDWTYEDAAAYDELLQDFPLDADGISIIREGVYAYVAYDDESFDEILFSVNIFTVTDGGATDPTEPVEPVEPGVVLTTTISAKGNDGTNIAEGNINSYLSITGGAPINVAVAHNDAQTKSLFNNGAGEIRLYLGAGNGNELIFTGSQADLVFLSITVNTSQNNGYAINGGAMITESGVKTTLTNATSISLQNVSTVAKAQVRITSIVIEYMIVEA